LCGLDFGTNQYEVFMSAFGTKEQRSNGTNEGYFNRYHNHN
jgi:hypothetical protein